MRASTWQFMAFFTPLPVDEEVESVQTELRMQALCEELRLMLLGTHAAARPPTHQSAN
jgi:hypothetical protein